MPKPVKAFIILLITEESSIISNCHCPLPLNKVKRNAITVDIINKIKKKIIYFLGLEE